MTVATLGLSEADRTALDSFRRDVIEPSRTQLVILDFWAEWCGPCKQLTPVLEKVAAAYADRGVILVKVNVDENRFIASQFRVQSIPTVYALFQGQPVADLSTARTEGQLKQAIDALLAQLPIESAASAVAQDIAPLIEMGEEILASGDGDRAASIFAQIIDMAPDNADALSGAARALVMTGAVDDAEAMINSLPPEIATQAPIERARAAIALARTAVPVDDLSALVARVAADPDDLGARFELAQGQMGNGDHDGAADSLLAIIAADRDWNDGAARTQLLQLFEVVGLADPWVATQRRRLSGILFA